MRVCHVVYSWYPFDPRVRKEVETLVSHGHEVDVITVRDTGQSREETVKGVRVHRLPMLITRGGRFQYLYQYTLFFILSSAFLLRLHFSRHFRVVHIHSLPDFQVFCALPLKAFGVRVILDLHEAMPEILAARFRLPLTSALARLAYVAERISCMFADRVILVTELRRRVLVSRGLDLGKTCIVMNSPELDPSAVSRSIPLRHILGLDRRRVLVQAGGLNAERDLETLVRAGGRLAEEFPLTLILLGKGDVGFLERLRAVARSDAPALEFRIQDWLPPEQAFAYVALTEVGVGTYERNPLTELAAPHKVFEYAALGRPLVLSDLEGLKSFWGDAALYYSPGDSADLAAKIRRVIEEPSLAAELQSKATALCQRFSWSNAGSNLVSLYSELSGSWGGRR